MLVPAPLWFSTTTCRPSCSPSLGAIWRAMTSTPPGGGVDVIARTSLSLLRLDAGRLHDFRPLFGFGAEVGAEFFRRAGDDFRAVVGKPRTEFRSAQHRNRFAIQARDDFFRRARRRKQPVPLQRFIAR